MTGTYKEFYNFVNSKTPWICSLWEDFNNRKDPVEGDVFYIKQGMECVRAIFDKVIFDDKFKNGVAFWYVFHNEKTNKEIRIRSINDVYDYKKLNSLEKTDIYRFWTDCKPIEIFKK